jgi:hypothetical protein
MTHRICRRKIYNLCNIKLTYNLNKNKNINYTKKALLFIASYINFPNLPLLISRERRKYWQIHIECK